MEYVEPPPLTVQRAGSLLAAAVTPTAPLTRDVQHGYHAGAQTGWRVYEPCSGVEVDVDSDTTGTVPRSLPFPVQVEDSCSVMGSQGDHEQRARDRLTLIEGPAIAREWWTGELATAAATAGRSEWADNPRLQAGPAVQVVAGDTTPVPIARGLAALEQALGTALSGAPGVVHMTREALTMLGESGVELRREGDLILTLTDTRVVGDAGYPGTGPDGSPAGDGEAWIYGTARPAIRMSDVVVLPGQRPASVNRDINHITVVAERLAMVTVTPGVWAVRVTL